jgi:2-oxoglutarate ferredoxin oxidoreductase subunit gamma
MNEKVIFAGFGGQGVMLIGQLLTYSGMDAGKEVSWLPSYGPEMRGGTANCHVIVSDAPISSPIITKATSVIIMNNPSLGKFEPLVVPSGDIFINSSLVDQEVERTEVNVYKIPANQLAIEIGSDKVPNMIMLGAYLAKHPVVSFDTLKAVMEKTMHGKKAAFISTNIKGITAGMDYMRKMM